MKILRVSPIIILVAVLIIFLVWSRFAPKEDISQRIYKTLKEQEKRADLSFKKVTFEEVAAGQKYWQLAAESAILNKSTGLATLQTSEGIFFKSGKPALKFLSPAALWDMKKKEIYLDKPLGYDANSERKILALFKTMRANPLSIFNLPKIYGKGLGYWFQAKNLSWKLADQLLVCSGGIVLNKGEASVSAESLRGDVEFENVQLTGSPHASISLDHGAPATLEAEVFELKRDKFTLTNDVRVRYLDIKAFGDSAQYFVNSQKLILAGHARAEQGESRLSSDKVMVLLKERKIALLGKSKVVIPKEEIGK